jgi:hypothetical protein
METRLKEEAACIICKDNDRNVVFQPCAHLCVCLDCSEAQSSSVSVEKQGEEGENTVKNTFVLKECPVCRVVIQQRQRIYN